MTVPIVGDSSILLFRSDESSAHRTSIRFLRPSSSSFSTSPTSTSSVFSITQSNQNSKGWLAAIGLLARADRPSAREHEPIGSWSAD
ncbi:unnamed protein product [Dovyalis caffra]|uniref:Uncharacterized protein n=1 Tax=Dovyalis caffra TaxID=77055 RepID=A0AAV1R5Y6_9ROSI|nr:unnamed protein product [Dovyalis caffra]